MLKLTPVAILAGAALCYSSLGAQARDLSIVSWGGSYQDAQKEVYFEPFQKATGIKMTDESWDGGVGVLRAKVEGGNSNWDVVQVEAEELALGCEEGLFEMLDWSKIGGKDQYLPAAVSDCGVGAIFWDFNLAYDGDKFADGPKNWADFFDLKTFPGKRGLRNGPKSTLEVALMADGVPADEVYDVLRTEEGVDRAFAKLDTIKDELIFWKAGAQPPQWLASGEVAMTSTYNGRISAANKNDGRNFKLVWDNALYQIDSWVILAGSEKLDEAYKFLDFVGKAENQKKLPSFIAYGVSNKAANGMVDAEVIPELPTADANIAKAVKVDVDFWLENIDRLNERFNKWAAK